MSGRRPSKSGDWAGRDCAVLRHTGRQGGVRPSGRGLGLSYCIVWRCDHGSDTGPLPNRFSDIFILLSFLSQEPAASLQAGPVSVTLYPSDMSDSEIFDIFVSTEQRCGRGPDFRPTGAFGFSSNNFANFGIPLLVPYTKDFERITQF